MGLDELSEGKKKYYTVLLTGMILSVVAFSYDMELLSAGIIIVAVTLLYYIRENSERPVFDERDISLAEESSHQALMGSGAFLGVVMIGISIGMGLNYISYPDFMGPVYLTWGGILLLALLIEASKRFRGV